MGNEKITDCLKQAICPGDRYRATEAGDSPGFSVHTYLSFLCQHSPSLNVGYGEGCQVPGNLGLENPDTFLSLLNWIVGEFVQRVLMTSFLDILNQ